MLFLGFSSDTSVSEKHMVHYQVPAYFAFALLQKIKTKTAYVSRKTFFSCTRKKICVKSSVTTYTVITVLAAFHIVLFSFLYLCFHFVENRVHAWLLLSVFGWGLGLCCCIVFFCFFVFNFPLGSIELADKSNFSFQRFIKTWFT